MKLTWNAVSETQEELENVQSPYIREIDVMDSETPALKFRSKATRIVQRHLKLELIIDFSHVTCWYSTQASKRTALNLLNFDFLTNLNLYQF